MLQTISITTKLSLYLLCLDDHEGDDNLITSILTTVLPIAVMSDTDTTVVAGRSDDRLDTINLRSALKESANSEDGSAPNASPLEEPHLDMTMLNDSSVSKVGTGYSSGGEMSAEKSRMEEFPPVPEWRLGRYLPVSDLAVCWGIDAYVVNRQGYSSKRMLKFKNPHRYYLAINLLAGLAILFYVSFISAFQPTGYLANIIHIPGL